MEERDPKKQAEAAIQIVERRSQRERDLSSAEVMKLIRKRSARKIRGGSGNSSGDPEGGG